MSVFGTKFERVCNTAQLNKPEECILEKHAMGDDISSKTFHALVKQANTSFFLLETRKWHLAIINTNSGTQSINSKNKIDIKLLGTAPNDRNHIYDASKK